MQVSRDNIPIGRKLFATYRDDVIEAQINFIPTYVLVEDNKNSYIGTKNNLVGTVDGYHDVRYLTGTDQINTKYLFNIHEKKKDTP